MRRICSMLVVASGIWAQQPAAKSPEKSNAPLTRSSFSDSGLQNEKILTDFFIGDFAGIPFDRHNLSFVAMFQDYLEAYGRKCDAYLPPNKVELMHTVCAVPETRIDRFGSRIETGSCVVYRTEGMGIYADPTVYAAKSKVTDEAGPGMINDVFQTMKQKNPLQAALTTLNETMHMTDDMNRLLGLNACVSPGLKRFQENIVLFSMGKQAIALPGVALSVTPRPQLTPGVPFKDQNYTKLLEDLIQDQSRNWFLNRFVSGSTSNVVISSRDSAGRPTQIVGKYLFNGRSQGSVTLSFSDGAPECLYFFDLPTSCKNASRTIAAAYANGGYPLEPGQNPPGGASAANPPPPSRARPSEPASDRGGAAKSLPLAAPEPNRAPAPAVTPASAIAAQQQRQQEAAERVKQNQERAQRYRACQQQALKDHPEGGVGLANAVSSCVEILRAK